MIHRNSTEDYCVSTYTKETLKGMLIRQCRRSDYPPCALRCVQEYHNPKVSKQRPINVLQHQDRRRNFIISDPNAVH